MQFYIDSVKTNIIHDTYLVANAALRTLLLHVAKLQSKQRSCMLLNEREIKNF